MNRQRLIAFAIVASVLASTAPIATVGAYTGTQLVVGSQHTDFGTGSESSPNTLSNTTVTGSGQSAYVELGNMWKTDTASMPTARNALGAAAANGNIYAIGGDGGSSFLNTVERYDPDTDSWSTASSMPTNRRRLGVVESGGSIYAIGGDDGNGPVATTEVYDPSSDSWSTASSMSTSRIRHGVAALNGDVYAIGGRDGSNVLSSVEQYDPETDSWSSVASLPAAREYLSAVEAGGYIYAIGGFSSGGSFQTDVYRYDPGADSWTTVASMPTPRAQMAVAEINDDIYAIGGYDGTFLNDVERYDPDTDSWSTESSMPTTRNALAGAAVNGQAYAIGGYDGTNRLHTVERYLPSSASGEYISADHRVENAQQANVNLTLKNAEATIAVEEYDGSSWSTVKLATVTSTANHTLDVSTATQSTLRTRVEFTALSGETTAELHDESILFENDAPTVDNASASPTGNLGTDSVTLSIDADDSTFSLTQGDTVTGEFFVKKPGASSFSSVGTGSISSNGTVSTSYAVTTSGTYEWKVELEDSYGGEATSDTFTFEPPAMLEIRNVTEPHAKLTSPVTAEVVVAGSNSTVDKRTVTNGEISLVGLDTSESYVVYVRADDYFDRSIYLEDIYDQQTLFMLNKSMTAVNNTFELTDNTGQFNERPKLSMQRIINRSVYDANAPKKYQWTAVAGDRLGAANIYQTTLEKNARYRITVKNVEGDIRSLGEYTAKSEGSIPLTIGTITWPTPDEQGFGVNASQVNISSSPYLKFRYSDPADNTSQLTLRVHELGNASNQIYEATTQDLGNYSDTVALPHTNHSWVANYSAERDGSTTNGTLAVGNVDTLPVPIPEKWLTPAIYIGLIALLSATPKASARTGAVVVAVLGAVVWAMGLAPISGPAVGVAGSIALLGKAGEYATRM
jgi:N-acetylneuraminic acid mutarotase